MYDVRNGGKRMTKRLTITLVALVLFVMLAVLPATAANLNQTNVSPGTSPVVFIGETGINITPVVAGSRQIAWFPSTAVSGAKVPEKIIDVNANMNTFQINPTDFGTRTGNWYCWTAGNMIDNSPLAFIVADPSISVAVWDLDQTKDISGKSVPAGERVTFRIDTNLYSLMSGTSRMGASNPHTPIPGGDFLAPGTSGTWDPDGLYIFNTTAEPTAPNAANGLGGIQRNGTYYGFNQSGFYVGNRSNYGFIDIRVKTPDNAILTELVNASINTPRQISIPLTGMIVDMQPWYWGNRTGSSNMFWNTSALDIMGHRLYPSGTYNVYAEVNINGIKDNYKNAGADYTGKTVSETKQLTLVANTVAITADKDTVTRSKPFSITITGRPATVYYLWVKGTTAMTGTWDDQPPMLMQQQVGLLNDTAPYAADGVTIPVAGTAFTAWGTSYFPQNSGTNPAYLSIQTSRFPYNGTRYLGAVLTNDAGTRTIQWMTTNMTKAQTYTFRVENWTAADGFLSDETDVKVQKGAVTITASGDQSYYLGEEIKFSGTNTETETTWLFITGPNLNANGAQIQNTNPRAAAAAIISGTVAGAAGAPQNVPVKTDNTWSWKWGTATYALDAGTYTVYATSASRNAAALGDVVYGTVSIVIKKPFVSATVSQSTAAQGDKLFIRGTAEGKPAPGVQIWILGKNYANVQTTSVNADASFEYELKSAATSTLYPGQYFVVVQHPMQNNIFDIAVNGNNVRNMQLAAGTNIFTLLGAGSLQGSDAAEALAQAINDPNVDDTYTKLQFLIEVPTIRIDSIGDRHVGDKFSITATTNLAVDDEVLFEVYSSSFKPTQKSQSGEFSGATGTVKVLKGDTGLNKLSFNVDASTFKPDEYLVTANRIGQTPTATGTSLFNVLEGAAPTAVPTAFVTTAAPTQVVTTVATPVPTATPTKTPTQPGFGALVALIGLGAVAFFVVRRH